MQTFIRYDRRCVWGFRTNSFENIAFKGPEILQTCSRGVCQFLSTRHHTHFFSFCPSCNSKQQFPETRAGNTTITHNGPWKCVQIDLIDYSKKPDGDLKYILSVKDHFTRYAFLRGLKNKTQKEVASKMLGIFSDFGVPSMIHCDNGGEFSNIANNMNKNQSVSQLILYKTVLVSTAL